jgi:hypothetical protein
MLRRAQVEAVGDDLLTFMVCGSNGQRGPSQASSVISGWTANDHGNLLRNAQKGRHLRSLKAVVEPCAIDDCCRSNQRGNCLK